MNKRHPAKRSNKLSECASSVVSEDDIEPVGFLRGKWDNMKKQTKAVKAKVSRQRGRFVKVIKRKFPARKEHPHEVGQLAEFTSAEAYPPLYPQLRDSWLKVTPMYVAKDLHRLIFRVTVKTSGIHNVLLSPPPKEERSGAKHTAGAVVALIKLLGRRMETEEISESINATCDAHLDKVEDDTDLIRFNMALFEDLGEDSKVLEVLKCVHQSLVLKPYGILRTQVVKKKLTKDIRSEDGWQVVITVATEGFIQVVHIRKEQSVDMPTPSQPMKEKNHWEYEWEVSMTFDKAMNDMTQSRLSITNLIISEGMDPALEEELKTMMQDGNLIVF